MDFDSLVRRLEAAFLPKLEQLASSLRTNAGYLKVRVVSLRHAHEMHLISIACTPTWSTDQTEQLALRAIFTTFRGTRVRLDLGWHKQSSDGAAYMKFETRGRARKIVSERDIDAVLKGWAALLNRFDKVAAAGKPSSSFMRSLRGAPRDWIRPARAAKR